MITGTSGLLLPESRQNKDIYGEPYDHWRTFPSWSPNGMSIAFSGFLDVIGQFDIWAADVAEADEKGRIILTDLTNLTNGLGGREPAWQPTSLLLLRASRLSRGDRSKRCLLINRASCAGAVRFALRTAPTRYHLGCAGRKRLTRKVVEIHGKSWKYTESRGKPCADG